MDDIIKFLTGAGLLTWLIKSIFNNLLSKDIENFKNELRRESEKELKETQHKLDIITKEHEAKMTSLYSKRLDIIAELYRLLIEFLEHARAFASPFEFGEDSSKDEKLEVLSKSAKSFYQFFLVNKIYLSEGASGTINTLWEKVFSSTNEFNFWRTSDNPEDAKDKIKAWREASNTMTKEVPPLLELVEKEFRFYLGVCRS